MPHLFLVLCQTHHRWVAQNQSFPCSYHPSRNFGPKSFDFQLFVFEVFHVQWLSRTIHMINIVVEEFIWLVIIRTTFGLWGLAFVMGVLAFQAVSYGDVAVAGAITALNAAFAAGAYLVCGYSPALGVETVTAIAKISLFWVVTIRTLSHVLKPLPPTYSRESEVFDNGFGIQGWRVCLTDLPLAIWLFLLGNVSELGAGMPGRLFNPVVYKVLSRCGYRSEKLISRDKAKSQAWTVVDCGLMAHQVTAVMFTWADGDRSVGGLEEGLCCSEKY